MFVGVYLFFCVFVCVRVYVCGFDVPMCVFSLKSVYAFLTEAYINCVGGSCASLSCKND